MEREKKQPSAALGAAPTDDPDSGGEVQVVQVEVHHSQETPEKQQGQEGGCRGKSTSNWWSG